MPVVSVIKNFARQNDETSRGTFDFVLFFWKYRKTAIDKAPCLVLNIPV
jgi:hypothetical protein